MTILALLRFWLMWNYCRMGASRKPLLPAPTLPSFLLARDASRTPLRRTHRILMLSLLFITGCLSDTSRPERYFCMCLLFRLLVLAQTRLAYPMRPYIVNIVLLALLPFSTALSARWIQALLAAIVSSVVISAYFFASSDLADPARREVAVHTRPARQILALLSIHVELIAGQRPFATPALVADMVFPMMRLFNGLAFQALHLP